MPAERGGQVIGVGKDPTVKGKSFTSQRKAAAFVRWHEPDDARVSRPESVSGSGRNSPADSAARLLTTMPGGSELTAHVLVAEIGVDMARFPTAGHLLS